MPTAVFAVVVPPPVDGGGSGVAAGMGVPVAVDGLVHVML